MVGKLGAAIALVAIVAAVAWIALVVHGRPQSLGLAQSSQRSPAPSPSPDDPLTLACRRPAVQNNSEPPPGGMWTIQPGSVAGYRAHEKFADLEAPHEAVARTDRLSGWILVGGATGSIQLLTGCVAIDVRTLHSVDQLPGFNTTDRDGNSRDMLRADSNPYVIFQPYPATLVLASSSTAIQRVQLSGDVQISGVTKTCTFALDARLVDTQLTVAGATTIHAGDFGVDVPQAADGFVRVDPQIVLEVSLILIRP